MRNLIVLVLLSLLLSPSCKKSGDDFQFRSQPDEPEDIPIDVDKDGEADFYILYKTAVSQGDFEPIQMYGVLYVEGDNAVFGKDGERSLFLNDFESMDYYVEPPFYWSESPFPNATLTTPLVRIERYDGPDKWPLIWEIESDTPKDEYLIGVKVRDLGGSELMGYIKISIDEVSGQVTLIEAELL
ncbi:MAG: hypothetical protein KDC24_13595 [Saprospiraceae bacterium]|nr:hypothetical protein [Saprospiraceae bacterium]